jgi:hypothetical protein
VAEFFSEHPALAQIIGLLVLYGIGAAVVVGLR